MTPDTYLENGTVRQATTRWRKAQRRMAWAALAPDRRVAAKQWIAERAWQQFVACGTVPLDDRCADGSLKPIEKRTQHWQQGTTVGESEERRQPAWWLGTQLAPTATPIWVPEYVQATLRWLDDAEVAGERTAGRAYVPRMLAAEGYAS